jgi:hypothetical protein
MIIGSVPLITFDLAAASTELVAEKYVFNSLLPQRASQAILLEVGQPAFGLRPNIGNGVYTVLCQKRNKIIKTMIRVTYCIKDLLRLGHPIPPFHLVLDVTPAKNALP